MFYVYLFTGVRSHYGGIISPHLVAFLRAYSSQKEIKMSQSKFQFYMEFDSSTDTVVLIYCLNLNNVLHFSPRLEVI